jgi:hypothetical protein
MALMASDSGPETTEAERIRAAVEIEREACAAICDRIAAEWAGRGGDEGEFGPRSAEEAADAIRERSSASNG